MYYCSYYEVKLGVTKCIDRHVVVVLNIRTGLAVFALLRNSSYLVSIYTFLVV